MRDEPKEPWEVAVDRFWEYVADINTKAEEMKKSIESSQLSEDMEWVWLPAVPNVSIQTAVIVTSYYMTHASLSLSNYIITVQ